jgi:hypothetical protein
LQATRAAAQAGRVHGHATRVIAPVFEPLQALNEDGNDVAGRNGADDATHKTNSKSGEWRDVMETSKKYPVNIAQKKIIYFTKI